MSSDPSQRLHPDKLDFDHIDTLDVFVEDLQDALEGSFPRSSFSYHSVHCLLLSWQEDDLNVQSEVRELRRVFERQFR